MTGRRSASCAPGWTWPDNRSASTLPYWRGPTWSPSCGEAGKSSTTSTQRPIAEIADRWISRYHQQRIRALADLKSALEAPPMTRPEFVYTTYINTTAEKLWQALTDPAFTSRYWA